MSIVSLVPLPDVATVVMGQSPPGSTYNERGDGLPFFQGKAEFGEISPTAKKWCSAPQRIAEPGDILMSVRAPVGPTNLAIERCCIGRGLAAIRANATRLDSGYLRFFLREAEPRLACMGQGSTFAAIGRAEISSLRIPLPSLDEQRRIVDLLSRAEGIVRLRREAQAKAQAIIPALFLDMFGDPATNPKGWLVGELGDLLARPIRNGVSPSRSGHYKGRVLTLSAITRGTFNDSAVKEAMFAAPLGESDEVSAEDLLVCRGNGNKALVGVGCFPHCDMRGVAFPDTAIAVRPKFSLLLPRFLAVQWSTRWVRQQIEAIAKTTNGTYKINQAGLSGVELIVPPPPAQREFDERVSAIESIVQQQFDALGKATAIFDSLLACTFNGESPAMPSARAYKQVDLADSLDEKAREIS